jgi:hypothetical protein
MGSVCVAVITGSLCLASKFWDQNCLTKYVELFSRPHFCPPTVGTVLSYIWSYWNLLSYLLMLAVGLSYTFCLGTVLSN